MSFSLCFSGLYKETLEVGSFHTVMPSRVGIGNSSFSLHCTLEVWSLLQSLYLTKTFGRPAYFM